MKLRRRDTTPREDIDAIPVQYRGTRLRSVLEGKWCVFFDQVGITWEYEPGAVNVAGRNRYVDFWLPGLGCYLEVKPTRVPLDEAFTLALSEQRGSPVIWLSGSPWPGEYEITFFGCASDPPWTHLRWAVGRTNHAQIYLIDVGKARWIRLTPSTLPHAWEAVTESMGHPPVFHCDALVRAYSRATSARFEE
jgi:hypothetical protein